MQNKFVIKNENDLTDIFYSHYRSGANFTALKELFWCINDKMLLLKKITISDIDTYHNYLYDISDKKIDAYDIQGGDKQHLAIKMIGKDFLKITNNEGGCEQWFAGRIPDLISSDKTIIIECGDTDPTKILEYFSNSKIMKIIVIPYPDPEINYVNAYLFTKTKMLTEYIDYKKECFSTSMKKFINR